MWVPDRLTILPLKWTAVENSHKIVNLLKELHSLELKWFRSNRIPLERLSESFSSLSDIMWHILGLVISPCAPKLAPLTVQTRSSQLKAGWCYKSFFIGCPCGFPTFHHNMWRLWVALKTLKLMISTTITSTSMAITTTMTITTSTTITMMQNLIVSCSSGVKFVSDKHCCTVVVRAAQFYNENFIITLLLLLFLLLLLMIMMKNL